MSASQNLKGTWKNVPTRTITAGGVEFAYRELGTQNPGAESGCSREKDQQCADPIVWQLLSLSH